MVTVLPIPHQLKSGFPCQRGKTRQRVFIRILRGDVFAFLKSEFLGIQIYHLCTLTNKVHLDSAMIFVIGGVMTESREIEICSQFPIGAGQNAKIEPRRDTFPVIVGRLQNPPGFFAINADQETSVAAAE